MDTKKIARKKAGRPAGPGGAPRNDKENELNAEKSGRKWPSFYVYIGTSPGVCRPSLNPDKQKSDIYCRDIARIPVLEYTDSNPQPPMYVQYVCCSSCMYENVLVFLYLYTVLRYGVSGQIT